MRRPLERPGGPPRVRACFYLSIYLSIYLECLAASLRTVGPRYTSLWAGPRHFVSARLSGPTARDTGAAPLTCGQARHACCSRCAHTGPVLQLEANVIPRRALELEHVRGSSGVGRPPEFH